jgi:hypothetical protein
MIRRAICWALRQPKKKERLVIDMREHAGGGWLQPVREAAERLRRAVLKQSQQAARKAKPKN